MTSRNFRAGDRVTVKNRPWMRSEVCTVLATLDGGIVMAKLDNPKGGIRIFPFIYLKPEEVDLAFNLPLKAREVPDEATNT